MGEEDKSKSYQVVLTIVSLAVFIFLFYLLLNKSPSLAEVFSLQTALQGFNNLAPKIVMIVLLFFIFKLGYIFVIDMFAGRFRGVLVSHTRFASIKKLIHFSWWALYALILVSLMAGNVGTLIASAGLIGLGLTFALQKPILNFVGWVTIILKEVYNEGDRIKVGGVVGDVKEIQLMNTVIYGLLENSNVRSHKIVTVPNEMVLTREVENYTKESNYIRDELKISITYESNFKKAMELLDKIVSDLIKKNLKSYIKVKRDEQNKLNVLIQNLTKRGKQLSEERASLDKERTDIKKEIADLQILEEEFQPKIRLEMADSSVELIAQFLTPYYELKKNRTAINVSFLDAIKKEKDIEVAYPHMELVYHGQKK